MLKTLNFIHQSNQTVMRIVKLLSLILSVTILATSCSKDGNTNTRSAAPAMNAHYFLPAYVSDATAPNARILTNSQGVNQAITSAMPDAIYYTTNIPVGGVVFTFKDQTGATLTTLTGVAQGTNIPGQYTVVTLPSSFLMPSSWNGKIVTISANNSTAFTKYRIVP